MSRNESIALCDRGDKNWTMGLEEPGGSSVPALGQLAYCFSPLNGMKDSCLYPNTNILLGCSLPNSFSHLHFILLSAKEAF